MAVLQTVKGRYEVRDVLGQGGMGIVYKAYDTRLRRLVAVKTIRDIPEPLALDMFQRECDVLAGMSHPNIVELFDADEFVDADGERKPYLVMPLLEGATLDQLLQAPDQLTVARCLEITTQACRGLHAAHERGLVHRDLKPSNIFVLADDSVKIIDFGVAHMMAGQATAGRKGTLYYMAPEQIEMKSITGLADQFALAVVGYQMLTGRRPFDGQSEREVARAILHQVPAPACDLNPAVSRAVSQVIFKAMAKKPFHRFANAREFAVALGRAQHGQFIPEFDPEKVAPRLVSARKALDQGDLAFANEILGELEDEGHIDPEVAAIRNRVDQAQRQSTVQASLAGARTRLQEGEYQLALVKVEEVLQIDPQQPDALVLKRQIESSRAAQKLEDWFRLAHRHIEAHAYAHAREALQNALLVRPNDTRARQMLADVDRQEQEHAARQQEKERLYQAALQAWQSGEISVALNRLERVLELDGQELRTTAEASTYQDLYNKVRSERDAAQHHYDEARRHFSTGNLDAALALCTQHLERYPGHALFQALRIDVAEAQRQRASAEIAEMHRRVAEEPDLDRRVSLLAEAVSRYPNDPHFPAALQAVRDRRDLINSIATRARLLEEQGQFTEALDQWRILRDIHSTFPGLSFEVERVQRRQAQQTRSLAKARWVQQIDRALDAGEYDIALQRLADAQAEFPQDAELAALDKLARQRRDGAAAARELLAEGRRRCEAGDYAAGIDLLWQAHTQNPLDPVTRRTLLDQLVQHGHTRLDEDWPAAEALAQQALDLEPEHGAARSLLALARDRQAELQVGACLSEARHLQAEGHLADALRRVEVELARHPQDDRLRQLQATLRKALTDAHQRDQEEARRIEREAARTDDPTRKESLLERARTLASRHTVDLGPEPLSPASPAPVGRPRLSPTDDSSSPRRRLDTIAAAAESAAEPPLKGAPLHRRRPALPRWALPVGALVPLLLFAGWALARRSPVAPGAATVPVELRSVPAGALVRVNNQERGRTNLTLPLLPGTYQVDATLPGHQAVRRSLTVSANSRPVLDLPLVPVPAPPPASTQIQVLSTLPAAKVLVDGLPKGDLVNGQLLLSDLSPGRHLVAVTAAEGTASFPVTLTNGVPEPPGPVRAANVLAVVAFGAEGKSRVLSSRVLLPVTVDQDRAAQVGPFGLSLPRLETGTHSVSFGDAEQRRSLPLEVGARPMLTMFVGTERATGALTVVTTEDGAAVLLNGRRLTTLTRLGQLVLPALPARPYQVQVEKDGRLSAPQSLDLKPGQNARLDLPLPAAVVAPTVSSLFITNAQPGTGVTLDGAAIGAVQTDGTFTLDRIAPGEHAIELRSSTLKPERFVERFAAGQATRLVSRPAPLPGPATLRVTATPPGTVVTITRGNEPPRPMPPDGILRLDGGSYTVTGRAPGHDDAREQVALSAGEAKTVVLRLRARPGPPAPAVNIANWDNPELWVPEADMYAREGGNFVLYKPSPLVGTVQFTATLRRGKRLRWVANFQDGNNYDLFELDKRFFYRYEVRGGKRKELAKVAHSINGQGGYSVQATIQPGSIVHRLGAGNLWQVTDTWSDPTRDARPGRFGLLIPGRDIVLLVRFSHQPRG